MKRTSISLWLTISIGIVGLFLNTMVCIMAISNIANGESAFIDKTGQVFHNIFDVEVDWEAVNPVYDGDTFRANIKADMPDLFRKSMPVRLRGIDCPEMNGRTKEQAIISRDYLISLLSGKEKIQLRNTERGKFFRLVADVYADDIFINEKMLQSGGCKVYEE